MPTGHPANVDSDEVVRLYCEERLSCNQIAQRLGVSERVPYLRLKRAGVPMRSRKEALGNGRMKRDAVRATKPCKHCGQDFEDMPHEIARREFCSTRCSGLWRRDAGLLPQRMQRPVLTCQNCGEQWQTKTVYEGKIRRFCSQPCARYWQHQHSRRWANTVPERIMGALLTGLDVRYEKQWPLKPFSADFYIPELKRCIEVDGDYWHKLPLTVQTDLAKEKAFAAAGIPVLHITESEMEDIARVRGRVLAFLR